MNQTNRSQKRNSWQEAQVQQVAEKVMKNLKADSNNKRINNSSSNNRTNSNSNKRSKAVSSNQVVCPEET
jgi:hypothetical protein